MKDRKRKILFGVSAAALCIVIFGILIVGKPNSEAAIPTDREKVEYLYGEGIERASVSLFTEDETFTFTPSFLSSYICSGSYEEKSGDLVLKDTSGSEFHFCIKKDKIVFEAKRSSEVPKFKYASEDEEPTPAFSDGAVFTLQ